MLNRLIAAVKAKLSKAKSAAQTVTATVLRARTSTPLPRRRGRALRYVSTRDSLTGIDIMHREGIAEMMYRKLTGVPVFIPR